MADDPQENEQVNEAAEGEVSEEAADATSGESGEGKKWRLNLNRKKLLMFGLPALLLLGGGGYAAVTMGGLLSSDSPAEVVTGKQVYYDLPEMVVNLSSGEKRVQYLKLKVSLEASNQVALDALNPVMPRVLDTFQLYLRELRSSDLEGSAGIFRLKEELLRRINLEIHPNQIDRVLFKEIIVQ